MNFTNIFHKAAQGFILLEDKAKKYIAIALTITGAIMTILSKGGIVLDLVLKIISPQMEAEIPLIKKYLAQAILILTSVDGIAEITQSPGETDAAFLETVLTQVIQTLEGTNWFAKQAFFMKLASILLSLMHGEGTTTASGGVTINAANVYQHDTNLQAAVAFSKVSSIPITIGH